MEIIATKTGVKGTHYLYSKLYSAHVVHN